MINAKLSDLAKFYGNKLDILGQVNSEFTRGQYIAYSIAKRMTENIVFELLDKQLSDSLKPDNDDIGV